MAADAPHPTFEQYADEAVPQAPVGAPGKDGQLELTFATDPDGTTQLVHDYARVPFHLSGTLSHDPHPDAETVYVQSPTGGVAQGDRHTIVIRAESDTIAHVSTQSATKVLSMEHNYAAADFSFTVGSGAHFEYVPDPVILHPDTRFCQDQTLNVTSNSSAIIGDVVVPGRLARGEYFDFEQYVSRLRSYDDDQLLFEDTTHLDPASADPTAPGILGEFNVYGTLYVITSKIDADALSDALYERMTDCTPRTGVTTIPNGAGIVVRILGHRAGPVTEAIHSAWDEARTDLLGVGAPDMRKY